MAASFASGMGAKLTYLDNPVTEKELLDGGLSRDSAFIRYGNCGMQGWRRNMEDAHLADPDFHDGVGLFGVFDGHGGRGVSRFAAKELPRLIKDTDGWTTGNYQQALEQAFLRLDECLLEASGRRQVQELDRLEPGEPRHPLVVPRRTVQRLRGPTPKPSAPARKTNGKAKGRGRTAADVEDVDEAKLFDDDDTEEEVQGSTETSQQKPAVIDIANDEDAEAEKENAEPSPPAKSTEGGGDAVVSDTAEGTSAPEENTGGGERVAPEEEDDSDDNTLVALDLHALKGESSPERQGCTAVVVMVVHANPVDGDKQPPRVLCANVGDSRAVLSRLGGAVALSEDHKPENPEETARIKKAGGKVEDMPGGARVNGDLNLSRAFGDFRYKTNAELPANEQVVTAFPEVRIMELQAEDEFIVIGCDGIWEKNENQELVDFIRSRLAIDPSASDKDEEALPSLSQICAEICDNGLCPSMELDKNPGFDGRGCDNMTAMVVQLKKRIEVHKGSLKRPVEAAAPGVATLDEAAPAIKRAKMDAAECLEQKQGA